MPDLFLPHGTNLVVINTCNSWNNSEIFPYFLLIGTIFVLQLILSLFLRLWSMVMFAVECYTK